MFKKYTRANIIFVFATCYFGIALLGKFVLNKEIFPFFHWSLYSYVPQNNEKISLYLVELKGEELVDVNLLSRRELLFANPIEVNTVLQAYYNCLKTNCNELTLKENLLISLLPKETRVNIFLETKDKKELIATIKDQKIDYVR